MPSSAPARVIGEGAAEDAATVFDVGSDAMVGAFDLARASVALEANAAANAAATAVVGAADESTALALELETCDARGLRETVTLPWRLIANGALAQTFGADAALSAETRAHATTMRVAAIPRTAVGTAMSDPTLGEGARVAEPADANGALPVGSPSPQRTQASAYGVDPPGAPAVAAQWSMRWMKWIEREGLAPTLWLRDFRIDHAETGRIVDRLRMFAREHGLRLERIVVNGREVWRNAHSADAQE